MKLLYDVVIVDTCPYRLVQTQRMSVPKANCRLRVIRRYQCQFTNRNKCTTLASDVDTGGGSAMWGQRVHRKSLYCSSGASSNVSFSAKLPVTSLVVAPFPVLSTVFSTDPFNGSQPLVWELVAAESATSRVSVLVVGVPVLI